MISTIEIWLFLLFIIVLLTALAKRLSLPAPLLVVLTGLALSLLPGLPRIDLNPALALYAFLPPLVFQGAVSSSWDAFRFNLRPILSLAVGLVLFTTLAVAAAAHQLLPGFSWPAAFVLGAIVAPPDDVAAIAVLRRLPIPRRLTTIIQGEGMLNDATSLTLFRFATLAVISGMFSAEQGVFFFVTEIVGEIAYGLLVGWLFSLIMRRLNDPENTGPEIALSLIVPFVAYLPVVQLGGSGVLAVVAAGFFLNLQFPRLVPARTRLAAEPFWQIVTFILNNFLFLLLGLQLRSVLGDIGGLPLRPLLLDTTAICMAVILARFAWVFPASYIPRLISPGLRRRRPPAPWQETFIVAWSGMRGAISLAAALAIPLATPAHHPFPGRNLIIFCTFCVILTTLVLQGLSLPILIRHLDVGKRALLERKKMDQMELDARVEIIRTGLAYLEKAAADQDLPATVTEPLRRHYQHRLDQLERRREAEGAEQERSLTALEAQLQDGMLEAEFTKLLELSDSDRISDEVMRRIEHDIDLEKAALGRITAPGHLSGAARHHVSKQRRN